MFGDYFCSIGCMLYYCYLKKKKNNKGVASQYVRYQTT